MRNESVPQVICGPVFWFWVYLNQELLKDGWCWWYRKYAPGNRELERLEKHAREAKQGLWVNPAHVPPWQWRKRTR